MSFRGYTVTECPLETTRLTLSSSDCKVLYYNPQYSVNSVMCVVIGPIFDNMCFPIVDNKYTPNMCDGIINRLLAPLPVPKYPPELYLPFVAMLCARFPFPKLNPLSRVEFIEQMDKPQRRKDQFSEAIEEYCDVGLADISMRKTQKLSYNPKKEWYQAFKAMRGVMDMNYILQVCGGCYIQPILDYLETTSITVSYPVTIDGHLAQCSPTFIMIKGMDLVNVPRLLTEFFDQLGTSIICSADYKTYERHLDSIRLMAEHWFYQKFYDNDVELQEWCHRMRLPKVMSKRAVFAIKIKDVRISGSIDTALGNTITNIFIWCYMAYLHNIQIACGVVEGDDSVVSLRSGYPTLQDFADCGVRVKELVYSRTVSRAGFCHLYWDRDYQLVRSPLELLLKLPVSVSSLARVAGDNRGLLKAKCMSYCYLYHSCPVIAPFVHHLCLLCDNVTPIFEEDGYHQVIYKVVPPSITNSTRQLCQELFSITIAEQCELEAFLTTLPTTGVYQHPILRRLLLSASYGQDVIDFSNMYHN